MPVVKNSATLACPSNSILQGSECSTSVLFADENVLVSIWIDILTVKTGKFLLTAVSPKTNAREEWRANPNWDEMFAVIGR